MDYRLLGRTGLRVSPLCLGTMNFGMRAEVGVQTEEDEGHRIMDRALDLGINFFDTANVYGDGRGLTESIIGRWFAQGDRRRERTVLATKVYNSRDGWPNAGRLSALAIRQACDDSLRRLQTDYIDLYQMHHVDRDTPWDEIWQAMDVLVTQGKVLYVGSSNFAGWHIVQANEAAARRHSLGLVSEQSLYNLNARTIELEVLPACEHYGVGMIPWSPLGGGLLGGVLADRAAGGRRGKPDSRTRVETHAPAAGAVGEVLRRARTPAGRRRAGVAAPPPGRDRTDHRPPHARAGRRRAGRARRGARRRRAGPARRDLPRPGRSCARGLRMVGAVTPWE